MPFIPHTEAEISQMLAAIGVECIDDLFDEIPAELHIEHLDLPDSENEMGIGRIMRDFADRDGHPVCFAGGGAYQHHIPAAVWELTTRGEYYTAYTPYQAEASQGTLQVIYEYQSMMAKLTAMEVSNASLYEGASALAEAALMAVRCNRKSKSRRVLVPRTVNPVYRQVLQVMVASQDIEIVELDFDTSTGATDAQALSSFKDQDITVVVVPQPNYFGVLEPVDALTDMAHELGAIVVAVINPTALALLSPPGDWGATGADIVCGEGQPLGIPLSSGGPYFGILCCKQQYVRQMPGRLVGRTTDLDGRQGFALTLQAREQHIRRAKATSNICTNQGLAVTAATIYMALMGPHGLEQVASACLHNTHILADKLTAIDGVEQAFSGSSFHEIALQLPIGAVQVIERLAEQKILAGVALGKHYDGLENCLMICATELRTEQEMDLYAAALASLLAGA